MSAAVKGDKCRDESHAATCDAFFLCCRYAIIIYVAWVQSFCRARQGWTGIGKRVDNLVRGKND